MRGTGRAVRRVLRVLGPGGRAAGHGPVPGGTGRRPEGTAAQTPVPRHPGHADRAGDGRRNLRRAGAAHGLGAPARRARGELEGRRPADAGRAVAHRRPRGAHPEVPRGAGRGRLPGGVRLRHAAGSGMGDRLGAGDAYRGRADGAEDQGRRPGGRRAHRGRRRAGGARLRLHHAGRGGRRRNRLRPEAPRRRRGRPGRAAPGGDGQPPARGSAPGALGRQAVHRAADRRSRRGADRADPHRARPGKDHHPPPVIGRAGVPAQPPSAVRRSGRAGGRVPAARGGIGGGRLPAARTRLRPGDRRGTRRPRRGRHQGVGRPGRPGDHAEHPGLDQTGLHRLQPRGAPDQTAPGHQHAAAQGDREGVPAGPALS